MYLIGSKKSTFFCSAGVGRTGTFISLDNLIREAKDTKVVDPLRCVYKMRLRRPNMVQVKVCVVAGGFKC